MKPRPTNWIERTKEDNEVSGTKIAKLELRLAGEFSSKKQRLCNQCYDSPICNIVCDNIYCWRYTYCDTKMKERYRKIKKFFYLKVLKK